MYNTILEIYYFKYQISNLKTDFYYNTKFNIMQIQALLLIIWYVDRPLVIINIESHSKEIWRESVWPQNHYY